MVSIKRSVLSLILLVILILPLISSQLSFTYSKPELRQPVETITTTYLPSNYQTPSLVEQSTANSQDFLGDTPPINQPTTTTNSLNDVVKPIPNDIPSVASSNLPPTSSNPVVVTPTDNVIPSTDFMAGPERICNNNVDDDKNSFTDCKDNSCNNQQTKDIGPYKSVCCNGVGKTQKSMQSDANNCGYCGNKCGKYKNKLGFNAQYACKNSVCDMPKLEQVVYTPPVKKEEFNVETEKVKTIIPDESKLEKKITEVNKEDFVDKLFNKIDDVRTIESFGGGKITPFKFEGTNGIAIKWGTSTNFNFDTKLQRDPNSFPKK